MRFFLIILFFSSYLFSEDSSAYDNFSCGSYVLVETTSTRNDSFYCSNSDVGDVLYSSGGTPETISSWAKKEVVISKVGSFSCDYVYDVSFKECEECNEPDSSSELPPPPYNMVWDIVYSESCNGTLGDKTLYDDAEDSQRTVGTETKNCCYTTTYYVARFPQSCPVGEQEVNGECYPNPLSCTAPMVAYDDATSFEQCQAKINIENEVGEWKTEDGFYKCCYEPYVPPTDYCTVKGDGWVTTADTTSTDCESNLDGVTVDSVDFTTREDGSTTCCVHNMDTNTTPPPDTNTTPPPDTNTTPPPDTNTTPPLDVDEKLDGIQSSIDSSSAQNHSDLANVQSSVDSSSAQNHSDLVNVQSSIDSSSAQNHSDLTDIKDIIGSLSDGKDDSLDSSKNGIDDITSQLSDIISDATTTIPQKFNLLYNYSFGTAPVFTVSNGSCVFESDTNTMGYIKFDLNPYIAMMRPYTTLMFTLLFIFISISWWYKAFKIIVSVVF